MEKRKFYTKDFTRRNFYEAIVALMEGDAEITEDMAAMIKGAAEYELEALDIAAQKGKNKAANGEKKDALQSDYANALREAVMPLLTADEPKTATELLEELNARGVVAPSGKSFNIPWIARVLNHETGVVSTKKVVTKITKSGDTELRKDSEATAYKLG